MRPCRQGCNRQDVPCKTCPGEITELAVLLFLSASTEEIPCEDKGGPLQARMGARALNCIDQNLGPLAFRTMRNKRLHLSPRPVLFCCGRPHGLGQVVGLEPVLLRVGGLNLTKGKSWGMGAFTYKNRGLLEGGQYPGAGKEARAGVGCAGRGRSRELALAGLPARSGLGLPPGGGALWRL